MKQIIIDTGSWTTKVGFAGDDEPKGVIPTLVDVGSQKGNTRVGKGAQEAFDTIDARCPLVDGYVSNWDEAEQLWNHVFKDVLSVDSSACQVLLTDSTTNSLANREKMAQLMFEKFNVGSLYIAKQSVLGMYSTGRLTGLVVDSGHVATHVVPMYEGYCVSDGMERVAMGGKAISDYLVKCLQAKGVNFSSKSFPVFEAAKMKASVCKVALDFDSEVKSAGSQDYALPDGTKVSVGKEATEAAELLFRPQLADSTSEQKPLPKVIQASIGKCEIDVRAGLTGAIALIGGTSEMSGFSKRVAKEATALLGDRAKLVSMPKEGIHHTWIGGSILASHEQTAWVTRQEYQDKGSQVVKKCP